MADDAASSLVRVGRVVGARGIKGDVRIASFTEAPEDVAAYGPVQDAKGRTFKLKVVGQAKGQVIARIAGVQDRNAAEALKGTDLFVQRTRLPEPEPGVFYARDLVGLAAQTVDGAPFGRVVEVHDYGAGASLEVAPVAGGATILIPFTDGAVPAVDIPGGTVTIDPPPGLLDDMPERPVDTATGRSGNED